MAEGFNCILSAEGPLASDRMVFPFVYGLEKCGTVWILWTLKCPNIEVEMWGIRSYERYSTRGPQKIGSYQ